jgi:hypothetical protein
MVGIGELGFRVRAAGAGVCVDERTFRPWAVATGWAGLWAVFSVREQKAVGCVAWQSPSSTRQKMVILMKI